MTRPGWLSRGLVAALCLAAAAAGATPEPSAPETRPIARGEMAQARLAAARPAARPVHMLRYPPVIFAGPPPIRPPVRPAFLPEARWDFRRDGELWTRAAMAAISSHGGGLVEVVPRDISTWCPGYSRNAPTLRKAFWVGMMSALAKHESTWNPRAVGGGDLWYGLLQIYPDTARRYGCRARTGEALMNPADNLSCAVRIMAVTVRRDQAIAVRDSRWRGVAADWGPMTNPGKIAEMAAWTREQDYCQPQGGLHASLRPVARRAPIDARLSTQN